MRILSAVCIATFLILSPYLYPTKAQETAEENLRVIGDIPPIKIGSDTEIELFFEDKSGLNWTNYSLRTPIQALLFYVSPLWRGMRDWFCHHIVEFHTWVEGPNGENLSGWHAIVQPSKIEGTTGDNKAKLKLLVRVDGPTSYPKATVVIEAVRKGRGGAILGRTLHRINVKAEHIYLVDIEPGVPTIEVSPGSVATVPVVITNRGNYIEVFRIIAEGKGVSPMFSGQVIALNPSESVTIYMDISTPFSFFDLGTPKSVEIKVYPLSKPDEVFVGSISVVSRGISTASIPIFLLIAILLAILIKLLFSLRPLVKRPKISVESKETKEGTKTLQDKEVETRTLLKKPKRKMDLEIKISQILKEQEKQKRKLNI